MLYYILYITYYIIYYILHIILYIIYYILYYILYITYYIIYYMLYYILYILYIILYIYLMCVSHHNGVAIVYCIITNINKSIKLLKLNLIPSFLCHLTIFPTSMVGVRAGIVSLMAETPTIQYNTIQYNTYNTMQYIQYNTIQYNTIHTIQYNTYNTIQYNTIHSQYNRLKYNTIQYNTIQYNTIQYNTIQYNTIHSQYNRLPYNTIHKKYNPRYNKRESEMMNEMTIGERDFSLLRSVPLRLLVKEKNLCHTDKLVYRGVPFVERRRNRRTAIRNAR